MVEVGCVSKAGMNSVSVSVSVSASVGVSVNVM